MTVGAVGRWSRQSTTAAGRPGGDSKRPANPSPRIRQSNGGNGGGTNPSCIEEWKRRQCGSGQAIVANLPLATEKPSLLLEEHSSPRNFLTAKKKVHYVFSSGLFPFCRRKKGGVGLSLSPNIVGGPTNVGVLPKQTKHTQKIKLGGRGGWGGGKDLPSSRILNPGSSRRFTGDNKRVT